MTATDEEATTRIAADQPTVLHIYRSRLLNESRIGRACRAVRERHPWLQQLVVGIQTGGLPCIERIEEGVTYYRFAPPPRGLWRRGPVRTKAWDRSVRDYFAGWDLRVVSAHSVGVLSLASKMAHRARAALLYEPHELESHTNNTLRLQRLVDRWIERRLIRECDGVMVVSDAIADWYARTYGITRPTVVRNVPELQGEPPAPNARLWRERFGIPTEHVVFIYQGGLFVGRRIEQLVRVFAQARPDRHVVFMGYGEGERAVRAAAARYPNIHYASAVPPGEVLRHAAGADVGLVGVENVCLSYYYSLPNKLFEYLHAGLPALMPDYPEMRRVAEDTDCGWVVGESDADWLAAVNRTDWDQIRHHQAGARAAADAFSWDKERTKLLAVYEAMPGFCEGTPS